MKKTLVIVITAAALLVSAAAPAWAYDRRFERFTIKSVADTDLMKVIVVLALLKEQNPPHDCMHDVPVRVQRRAGGKWKTIKKGRTNNRARWSFRMTDSNGRYRAVAPRYMTASGSECYKSVSSAVTHQAQ